MGHAVPYYQNPDEDTNCSFCFPFSNSCLEFTLVYDQFYVYNMYLMGAHSALN